jgi:ribosomal protein L40E
MPADQMNLPAAGCAKCGRAAPVDATPGSRCANLTEEGPCDGLFRATSGSSDWMQCLPCGGSGAIETQRCRHCDGSGWHYARPRFP